MVTKSRSLRIQRPSTLAGCLMLRSALPPQGASRSAQAKQMQALYQNMRAMSIVLRYNQNKISYFLITAARGR
jgi:hypothetical protein